MTIKGTSGDAVLTNLETPNKVMKRYTTNKMNRTTKNTNRAWRFALGVLTALTLWVMAAGTSAQAAAFTAGPATITSEDCTNVVVNGVTNIVTGIIDPGERVTVSFAITNTSGSTTTFLFASLLPGNNVTAPSGAQSVGGGVLANGANASVSFTFVASGAAGGKVIPTLVLQDGVTPVGTLPYPAFNLGQAVTTATGFGSTLSNNIPAWE